VHRYVCGDGRVDPNETCDDGNLDGGDGCSELCQLEDGCEPAPDGTPGCQTVCGDGVLSPGEECDGGSDAMEYGAGCAPDCTIAPFCGDGVLNAEFGETCDPGPYGEVYGPAGCTPTCQRGPYCGDGIVDVPFGEECDPEGFIDPDYGCTLDCFVVVK
jgi:cysteine-rich repeat protein